MDTHFKFGVSAEVCDTMLSVRRTRAIRRLKRAIGPAERDQCRAELHIINTIAGEGREVMAPLSKHKIKNDDDNADTIVDAKMQDDRDEQVIPPDDYGDFGNVFAALHARISDMEQKAAVAARRLKEKDEIIKKLVEECEFLRSENAVMVSCEATINTRMSELDAREECLEKRAATMETEEAKMHERETCVVWEQAEGEASEGSSWSSKILEVMDTSDAGSTCLRDVDVSDTENDGAHSVAASEDESSVSPESSPASQSSGKAFVQQSLIAWRLCVVVKQIAKQGCVHRAFKDWRNALRCHKKVQKVLDENRKLWSAFADGIRAKPSS